jgi:hypothetical protein
LRTGAFAPGSTGTRALAGIFGAGAEGPVIVLRGVFAEPWLSIFFAMTYFSFVRLQPRAVWVCFYSPAATSQVSKLF